MVLSLREIRPSPASTIRAAGVASRRCRRTRWGASSLRRPSHRRACTRWSVRSMARHVGISSSTVQRIWSKNDLKPHVVRTFKLSNDPKFEEKFWDVIGLYLNPPEKALRRRRRREKPVPGAGTVTARPAIGAGPSPNPDPRLPPSRHGHAVRRPQLSGRHADFPDPSNVIPMSNGCAF